MNSTFHTRWLVSLEVISQVLFTSEQPKKNKMAFVGIIIVTSKVTLGTASYSACVVYTKTIIHLSVGESGGYLPLLWWIIVNYNTRSVANQSYYLPRARTNYGIFNIRFQGTKVCDSLGKDIKSTPFSKFKKISDLQTWHKRKNKWHLLNCCHL